MSFPRAPGPRGLSGESAPSGNNFPQQMAGPMYNPMYPPGNFTTPPPMNPMGQTHFAPMVLPAMMGAPNESGLFTGQMPRLPLNMPPQPQSGLYPPGAHSPMMRPPNMMNFNNPGTSSFGPPNPVGPRLPFMPNQSTFPQKYPNPGPTFCSQSQEPPYRDFADSSESDGRISDRSPEGRYQRRGDRTFSWKDSDRSSNRHDRRDSTDRRSHHSRERNPERGSRKRDRSESRRDYTSDRERSSSRSSVRHRERDSSIPRRNTSRFDDRSKSANAGRNSGPGRFREENRSREVRKGERYFDKAESVSKSSDKDVPGSSVSDSGEGQGSSYDKNRGRRRPRDRSSERSRDRDSRKNYISFSEDERSNRKRNRDSQSRDRDVRKRSRVEKSLSPSPGPKENTEKGSEGPSEIEEDIPKWMRCSPADLYFTKDLQTGCMVGSQKMKDLEEKFKNDILMRAEKAREGKPKYEPPKRPVNIHHHHHHHHDDKQEEQSSESDCSVSSSEDEDEEEEDSMHWMEELTNKIEHPHRLHSELWLNERGEMNDGPLCRCSLKSRQTGIRHNIYPGEDNVPGCDPDTNNIDKLFHYRVTMSPVTNFLTKTPTIIEYDNHEYIFEGFSLFSHYKLENIPICKVIRFNIEYTIHFFEEQTPENFSVRSLDMFSNFLFQEILELVDLDWKYPEGECNRFHMMPRFARALPESGKELLSMNVVLNYLCDSSKALVEDTDLAKVLQYEKHDWQQFVDKLKGMIVTKPGKKPSSVRIDQLDPHSEDGEKLTFPVIVHFGIRPAQLSYAGDPKYQKAWKQFVKYKHLLTSKPKVTYQDKQKLILKETSLQKIRQKSSKRREVTVELDSQGFIRTGIKSDICQHAMLLPVLICHLRFHKALNILEKNLDYSFKDRNLLQLSLTHTSYRVNFGTNPDHARNSLSNCGIRNIEYGDRKIHYTHTRKRGINILIDIMSRMGHVDETISEIPHNERLEFLGDAVVEFISSVHLFYMFPWLEEGGLTTYRAAIVQNQHLAVLAKKLHLEDFMLYAHGPDLCHESDLKHAMANCFEALMGALFIDGGIELVNRVFGQTLFGGTSLYDVWIDLPKHPLQQEEPNGDRQWVESSPALQKLLKFEESTGIPFTHIRLLARAFTLRNVGYNILTLGHNQRLEFLGDTVLQLVSSEYLFKHFPDHHEGHLSLLRSSLVNNRTQSIVCDDLVMTDYVICADARETKVKMKTKEKADLLEAFIGALFIDKGLEFCQVFCGVCFFPRLKDFILNQEWNDPKSQLQQCCLTLREVDGGEPDIPAYKVLESNGPTNTRTFTVAVYFRNERLATGTGYSIQQAEMSAAMNALKDRGELFPILEHQKRFLAKKYKKKGLRRPSGSMTDSAVSPSKDSPRRTGDKN